MKGGWISPGSVVLALGLLLAPGHAGASALFDGELSEEDLRSTLAEKPVCLVAYHVGKGSEKKASLEKLVDRMRTVAGPDIPFYHAEIGAFELPARNQVIREIGKNEFPTLVVYHAGVAAGNAQLPVENRFQRVDPNDPLVERFTPLFTPAAPRGDLFVEPPPEGFPVEEPSDAPDSPPVASTAPLEAPSEPAPVADTLTAP